MKEIIVNLINASSTIFVAFLGATKVWEYLEKRQENNPKIRTEQEFKQFLKDRIEKLEVENKELRQMLSELMKSREEGN